MNTPNGVQEGDRIRLLAMPEDPCPIEVGDEGIVTRINDLSRLDGTWQIGVDWVSGRSLMLVVPPDKFDIVVADTCRWCQQDIWPTGRDEDGAEWRNAEGEVVCLGWAQGRSGYNRDEKPHEPQTIDDEVKQNLAGGPLTEQEKSANRRKWWGLTDTRDEVLRPDWMERDPITGEVPG